MPEVRLEMGTTVSLPKTALPGLLANLKKMRYDVSCSPGERQHDRLCLPGSS